MASTYLTRTFGTPTNNKIWTCSVWLKRANSTNNHSHLSTGTNTSNRGVFYFNTGTSADFQYYEASGGSAQLWIQTNQQFRDCNGWYHIVVSVDTTQATASNRWKLYVNGEQVTSFASATYPSQNYDTFINKASARHDISGRNNHSNADFYWEGAMSHYHFIDGTAYDASAFGETDSTTGEWKIKTSPSVTYGNNGFFILKDGNTITDQSPNSNNFTLGGGTLTKTEDCPDNVFATLNSLSSIASLSNGNTKSKHGGSGSYNGSTTTLGMTSGKYYCEAKLTVGSQYPALGISATNSLLSTTLGDHWLGEHDNTYGYYTGNGYLYHDANATTGLTTFSTNDIIGLALDLDSTQNTLKYYKNGTLVYTLNVPDNSNGWLFADIHTSGDTTSRVEWNFGNGYFRSTAVSSAGTNASGNGIFEYDVPTGYTALSTKGLNL
jgi:hypothetical protein